MAQPITHPFVSLTLRRGVRRARPHRAAATAEAMTTVASFARYADARHTVALLAQARFPVHRTAVVAGDLRLVEDARDRVGRVRAAGYGAVGGAWLGLLTAMVTLVADLPGAPQLAVRLLWAVALGAVFGAVLGGVGYELVGGRQEFAARTRLVAGRYDLQTDEAMAEPARRLLLQLRPPGAGRLPYLPDTGILPLRVVEPAE